MLLSSYNCSRYNQNTGSLDEGRKSGGVARMGSITFVRGVRIGLVVLVTIWLVIMVYLWTRPLGTRRDVTARVIRIAPIGAAFPMALVTAQSPAGITGHANVAWDNLRCHVGDNIGAVELGVSLKLKPATCRSPSAQTSSTSRP